jgi:hypothetical protein
MKSFLKFSTLLLLAGTLFIGCKGKDGEPGPVGATGKAGTNGASGPSAQTYTFSGTFTSVITGINYTGLVGKVSANDAVLLYLYTGNTAGVDYYSQLPITFPNSTMPFVMYSDLGDNGDITVNIKKLDNSAGSPISIGFPAFFKVIHVKGTAGLRIPSINYSNYEEVKAYYNIED